MSFMKLFTVKLWRSSLNLMERCSQ